jgi:hypothetical protein
MFQARRPAQVGDVCILIEPIKEDEIARLQQRQRALQALFGGAPIEHVHLTCQRFVLQEPERWTVLVQNLRQALAAVRLLPFTALSLETLYVPVLQANILKWRIQVTRELQHLARAVEEALLAARITPLYAPGSVSSLIAALRGVPELSIDDLRVDAGLPHPLFTARKMVLSRIDGPDEFTILATIHLSEQ